MSVREVRAMHKPFGRSGWVCERCAEVWPCETLRLLGPDPWDPPWSAEPVTLVDGTQMWPGDDRFAVTVANPYGESTLVFHASSLRDALEQALAVPFAVWMADRFPEDSGASANAR